MQLHSSSLVVQHHRHTFRSAIILRKSVNELYESKSSSSRDCWGNICLGRERGTGSSSGITEWCVISALRDVNSLVKPWK